MKVIIFFILGAIAMILYVAALFNLSEKGKTELFGESRRVIVASFLQRDFYTNRGWRYIQTCACVVSINILLLLFT